MAKQRSISFHDYLPGKSTAMEVEISPQSFEPELHDNGKTLTYALHICVVLVVLENESTVFILVECITAFSSVHVLDRQCLFVCAIIAAAV